ncbi:phosphatidate cytidylyltransferase [Treponema phagedenis F0421]|nr:hypothetical protein [Treponema phagedenis]EFW37204.1 phosphatidate cytidylyltransferase [Treponema phagedenis F0421]
MMGVLSEFRYRKISQSATVDDLVTEFFRKTLHISSAIVTVFASYFFVPTVIGIIGITILYCISELLRFKGHSLPLITKITRAAARKRDRGHFVLGPLTLALGVLAALLCFPIHVARIAIFALAFGDGSASLVGKIFGQKHLSIAKDKTVEGSFACFIAVLVSSFFATFSFWQSLVLAAAAVLIEMLPLKDFDNLLIPICIGALCMLIGA